MTDVGRPAPARSGPHVCVLLATYNGGPWVDEQLDSIFGQQGVRVSVVASDDSSSDDTVARLRARIGPSVLTLLPGVEQRFGCAHRNFLRLIRDAELGDADYFALSDQDDVWLPSKLARAVECLSDATTACYSSNVTAFWSDGRRRLIHKAQPQRRFDFLFESAGPGCTFVFTRPAFVQLRDWVMRRFETLQELRVHDWLIYALARRQGWRWYIDPQSHMRYRQHARNEVGANKGLRAARSRWALVRSGRYRDDVLAIAAAVDDRSAVTLALRRFTLIDRFRLAMLARQCRRDSIEAWILAFFFLVMPRSTGSSA